MMEMAFGQAVFVYMKLVNNYPDGNMTLVSVKEIKGHMQTRPKNFIGPNENTIWTATTGEFLGDAQGLLIYNCSWSTQQIVIFYDYNLTALVYPGNTFTIKVPTGSKSDSEIWGIPALNNACFVVCPGSTEDCESKYCYIKEKTEEHKEKTEVQNEVPNSGQKRIEIV